MSGALSKISAEVSDFTKTMGSLHHDVGILLQRNIARFLEVTNDLSKQMNWQGWATIGMTSFNAAFSIAGTFFPKVAGNTNTPAANPRLGAHDGITDGFSNAMKAITQKLSDNDFLRSSCKTAAKGLTGFQGASDVWFRAAQTKLESERTQYQSIQMQDNQQTKGSLTTTMDMVQNAWSRIIQAKGGNQALHRAESRWVPILE